MSRFLFGATVDFEKKDKIFLLLFGVFFATLYLKHWPVINNLAIGLIFAYSLFYHKPSEKWNLLKSRTSILFMLMFYAVQAISVYFSQNKTEGISLLALRVPLLIFPLFFGTLKISRELKYSILRLFCISTTIAAIVCLCSSLILFKQTHQSGYLYDDNLSDIIGKQSIYFAQMVNIAIFSYVFLLFEKGNLFVAKGSVYLALLFLLGINFLLASRMAILLLYTTGLIFAFYQVFRRKMILEGLALVFGLAVGSLLLYKMFPKTLNRFRELGYRNYTYSNMSRESHFDMEFSADQWNGANIRLAVWSCGLELFRENWLFGAQIGDRQDKLMEVYKSKNFQFAVQSRRNMHNNYLDILVSFGITGFLIFFTGYFLLPLYTCIKNKDAFAAVIILSLGISLFSENYYDRSIGCTLLAFFICFMISSSNKNAVPV